MKWSCNDEHSVRQGTSWNTLGILWRQDSRKAANFEEIKSCNSLRHARFSQQVFWDVTPYCWASSSDVSTAGLPDRTGLSDHEDGGITIDRTVGTTRPRPKTRRHIAHHLVCRLARSLHYSTRTAEDELPT
jgi:hypothetical protein